MLCARYRRKSSCPLSGHIFERICTILFLWAHLSLRSSISLGSWPLVRSWSSNMLDWSWINWWWPIAWRNRWFRAAITSLMTSCASRDWCSRRSYRRWWCSDTCEPPAHWRLQHWSRSVNEWIQTLRQEFAIRALLRSWEDDVGVWLITELGSCRSLSRYLLFKISSRER